MNEWMNQIDQSFNQYSLIIQSIDIMPRAPRTTDPPASPATALIDDESLRSLGDADGRVIVIDGVRVVADHHRSSSWMDDAETKDDATTLRRSRSAGSDARVITAGGSRRRWRGRFRRR